MIQQHGIRQFNPYEFTVPLIDELLQVCALGIEPKALASNKELIQKADAPWWKRWFGNKQSA
ncbi:hypothetical protein [Pleionea litopenaei]|uniref:Uncharacterized protein n=1 Tax=Pleionea litopenaei TaxID=3070815 RepID=A0AA51RUL5_9GAMM|nr:hypothetical protein [Pleionea sp. HL-JVS1]WMS87870.1 hypothetical protein Q9312_02835 [Pleionea sp. HL-JVS1]